MTAWIAFPWTFMIEVLQLIQEDGDRLVIIFARETLVTFPGAVRT